MKLINILQVDKTGSYIMSLRLFNNKYEPMGGTDYVGGIGDLWVDLVTGLLHFSDGMNPGGNTVVYTNNANITTIPDDLFVYGTIYASQGSATNGGYTFINEGGADTGMYSPGDGDLRFYSQGNPALRIPPGAGNVTIYGSIYQAYGNTHVGTTYAYDVSGQKLTVSNGGTVNFPNFSGSIVVNDQNGGNVEYWLAGGGAGATVRIANTRPSNNTLTYNAGLSGYVWTNNSGGTGPFTFAPIRMRTVA